MFEFLQDPRWAGLDLPTKKAILGNAFNEDLKPDIDLEFIKDPRWEGFDSQTKKSILRATYERDVQPRVASFEPAAQVEILKSYLNEAYQTEQAQQIKAAPERRGTLGRLASGLARGTVETIGRAGPILELADLQPKEADTDESFLDVAGRGITDWSQRVLREYEFLKQDKGELMGEPGLVKRGLTGIAEYVPQSLPIMATAWAGAKAGAAVGGVVGAIGGNPATIAAGVSAGTIIGSTAGAIAGLVAFFGAGTYGDEYTSAYEELKRTRPEATEEEVQEVAHRLAFRSAKFEVGTEIPPTLLGLRMLGGAKVLIQPLKATLRNVLSQTWPEFAKKWAAATAGEVGGEMVAGAGQAWARQAEGLSGPTISEGIKESIIPAIGISLFFGAAAAGYNRTQSRSMMNQLNSEDIAAREAAIDTMAYRINANTQDPELALAWRAQALDFAKSGERFDFDEKVIEFAKIKTAEEYKGSELKQVDTTDYGITDAPDIDEAVDRFNQALEQPPEERELTELESRRQDVGLTLSELAELPIDQAQDLLLKGREATTELYPGLQAEYTGPKGKQRILLVEQNEDESWKARSLADGLELTAKPDRIVPVPALEPGREIEYQTKKGLMRGALIEPLGETAWRARDDKGKPFVALADKISPVAIKGEQITRPRAPKIESLLSEIDRLTERTKFAGPSRDAAIKKQARLAEGVVENVKPGDIVTDRDGEQLGIIDKIDDKSVVFVPDNINPKGISFPVKDFIGLFVPDKTGTHGSIQTKEATYAGTVRSDAGQVLPGAVGALEKNAQREGAPEGDQGEALRQRAGKGSQNILFKDREARARLGNLFRFSPDFPTNDTVALQSATDNINRAIKERSNLTSALSRIPEGKKISGGDVDNVSRKLLANMQAVRRINPEIFRKIVEAIPINVMNDLSGEKGTAKEFFGDKPMLGEKNAVDPDAPVSALDRRIAFSFLSGLKKTDAVTRAKFSFVPDLAWLSDERLLAKVTNELFHEGSLSQHQAPRQLKSQIDEAAHEAAVSPLNELPEPTDPQKIAGNAKLGHIPGSLIGLPRWKVSVENPKDSIRTQAKPKDAPESWKPKWSNKMTAHYGYFVSNQAGLESPQGKDKDKVDVYIGDQPEAKTAFIVDQINPETKKFDEHKVITSVIGEEAAKDLYNSNYSKDWKGIGAITEVSLEELDAWLGSEGRKTEPIAYGKDVARETTGLQPIVWRARKSMGMSFYSTPIEGDTLVIRENPSGKNRFTVYKKSDGPVKNIGKFSTLEAAKEAGATIIPRTGILSVHDETIRSFDEHLAAGKITPETHATVKDVVSILKEHELEVPIVFDKDATHSTDGKRKIQLDLNNPKDVSFLKEYDPEHFTERRINEYRQKNSAIRIYGEYSNYRGNRPDDRGKITLYDGANPADTYEELVHALQAAGVIDPGQAPKGVSQSAHEEAHAKQIVKDLLAGKEIPNVRKRKVSGEVKDAGKKAEPPSPGTGQRSIRAKGGAREHAFTKTPAGHEVTAPAISYSRGVDNKGNVWVRQSGAESNDGRQLLVQFSTELINKNAVIDESSRYYDALYSGTRKGYQRLRDFWEIPQWMGYVSKYLPNADVYVVRDMAEARQFLDKAGYDRIVLSAIDVNKDLIKTLAGGFNGHVDIGGYTTPGTFDDLSNAKWHDTLESLATDIEVPFSEGVDYRHFEGAKVIPRLTMSQGCLHKCAFCTVPKTLVQTSNEVVDQQAEAFGVLGAQLVYLNDKTFGQAKNYTHLENVYQAMLKNNPDFKGFIIQTTGTQLLKMDAGWLKRSGIKYVELGVETYNEKKPHNEAILDRAAQKLREANIAMIPNIIIGLPDETAETYQRTLDFIERNVDIISHENIYNLALYEGSELATRLEATSASDVDENVLEKSFHKDEAIHKGFSQKVFAMGMRGLEEGRAPQGIQYSIRDASRIQAGSSVKVGSVLFHVANPINRKSILKKGLLPKKGEQLLAGGDGYVPAIYVTNSTDIKDSFDSTYDDDIYKISTEGLSGAFYRDLNFDKTSKHVLTFDKIPVENITLVYRGTGKDKDSIREGVKKGQFSIRAAKPGTVIPWRGFGRYLERLPLSDTFGKLSLKERRALAAAGESWKLTAIDPITLKEVSPVGVKTKFPVIIAEGNIIDGVRRINAAIANKDKAILAWVAQDKPELPAKIPTATIYQMVQEIHHNYDDFIEGDLGDRLDKYSYYQLQSIALKDLDLDEWQVHESLVTDIKKQIQGASQYPPIVVGADMSIIDGIHRANALRELGYSKVQAYVGLEQDRHPENTQYAIRADTREEMAGIKRAELKAKRAFPALWIPKTYAGYGKYIREPGLGTFRYGIDIDGNSLYDAWEDPLKFDEAAPDIRYAVRPPVVFAETTTPVVPQDYIENRVEAQAKGKILGAGIKMAGAELGAEVSKLMAPISTRLKYINPALSAKLRRLDFETHQAIQQDRATVLPLLRKAKGMSPGDFLDWDYARKNSDVVKINELVNRYNMQAEYAAVRAMFDDLRDAAIDVGLDIGEIDEYWTRKVVDIKGLYEEMNREELGIFSKALAEKAASLGLQVYELDPDMRATLITNVILGGPTGVGGVSAAKERKFLKIPPRLNKYYLNSDAAVLEHISAMRTAIEKRKFFGKIPEKVAEMRRQLYVAQAKVREYQHLYRTEPDPIKKEKARVKRNEWIGEEKQLTAYIQKYALQRDYTDNIGAFIDEMIVSGDLKPSDENEVKEILQARFHERGAHGFWSLYKNFSYIDTMGSPISALTQIGDLAWAMYEGGMISGLKHAGKSLAGTSKITRADVGIERIAEEFADNTKLGAAVTWVFKHTGLEKMDAIGKEALLNATLEKQQKLAREHPQELANKIQHIFGNETTDTINALQNDIITENVKMLVYSRLADFQPVGLSEMPQRYLTSGNGRIFYMLKTFTLKQFDVFRNEAIHKITSGSRSEKIEGLKNLMRLAMLFVLANATADELKDFVLGRQTDFSDRVADNILRLAGSSKFVTWTARSEGLVSAFAKQVLPPFKFVDSLSKDIYNAGDDKGLELTASIPLIGKLAYWHLGRGTTKRHELWDVRLRKYKANLTEVHEDLEKAVDKVAYRKEHSVELARYREVNRFQGRLNNYRKIINNLKSRPEQTDAIQKRIEQLETRRTESIKQFLEKKETQNEER